MITVRRVLFETTDSDGFFYRGLLDLGAGDQIIFTQGNHDGTVVYACKQMSSALRARLVSKGVPFAVPGNQLYIPQLATDLREHYRSPDRGRGEFLSPIAQLVLFHYALRQPYDHATP